MYENKVILLMTTAEKKWHYLAVKSFSAILHGIKLKYLIANKFNSSFYCINYFHSFKTENKLILYKNICINHDYSYKKKHEIHNVLTWSLYLKQLRWYKDPEKTTTTKLNILHVVIHYLHTVHLIEIKINMITTEVKTAWKKKM